MTMSAPSRVLLRDPGADAADHALVRQALTPDPVAMSRLLQRLTPIVNQRVRLLLWNKQPNGEHPDVADLSQDVFLRLFADGGRVLLAWDPAAGLSLAGFVRLVTQREVVSVLRSRRRTPLAQQARDPVLLDEQEAPVSCSLDTRVHSRQRLQQVEQQLRARVSDRGMDIFRRLFVQRDSPQRISSELRLTLVSVYQWRTRLARVVREAVGTSDEGAEPGEPRVTGEA